MSFVDYAIISIYFLTMIGIGIYALKRKNNIDEYYIGKRQLGSTSIGFLWLASWIGGATVVGSVDKAYEIGISAVWYCGAMAIGCAIFSITSSKIIQKLGKKFSVLTYPELIELRYGPSSRLISTITTLTAYIAYSAGQFLAMAHILNGFLGIDLNKAIIISAAIIIAYTAIGGFLAVSITSVAQIIIMLIAMVLVMLPILFVQINGFNGLTTNLEPSFFDLYTWGWLKISGLVLTIILTFFTSMDSYTRCFAAKNSKSAMRGTLFATFLILIVALSSTFIGMAAKVLITNVPQGESIVSILINNFLPNGVKGLVIVGILAAIMSTGSVCLLVASANITKDIYHRFINKKANSKKLIILASISAIIVGFFSSYLAIARKDIIDVLYIAFTVNSAGLFVPTIAAFFSKKANSFTAAFSMGASLVVVIFWYIAQGIWPENNIFKYDPVWPGLIVSSIIFIIGAYTLKLNDKEKEKIKIFWATNETDLKKI